MVVIALILVITMKGIAAVDSSFPAVQGLGRTLSWLCPPDMARLSRASLAGLANCGTPCMCACAVRNEPGAKMSRYFQY